MSILRKAMPKKKNNDHANHERWLVSYADFITLLFAFFVILYATSKTDAEKFKKVAESIEKAFAASNSLDLNGASSGEKINQLDPTQSVTGNVVDMPMGKTNFQDNNTADLKHLVDVLEESISFELGSAEMAEKIQIQLDERGLTVRLSAKDFYLPASAEVRTELRPVLDQIAKVLRTTKRNIRIEGHTDDSKVSSELYPSNWELSTARAAWLVRYLIMKHELKPGALSAAGFAEYHPVAPNDTASNRAKNRRVEITILAH